MEKNTPFFEQANRRKLNFFSISKCFNDERANV